MGKRTFTKSQQSAIDTRDKTLLVSAAAGSGKTATLIERIVRSVLDQESPIDINRMLIVTFTKAAAAELRTRLTRALTEALLQDPDNTHLEKQIYLLPGASISTIDAFCNSILKNNIERFGISPKYRIADPIEAKILSHNVWSELIEAAYSGKLENIFPSDFEELAGTVTSVKSNSALEEIFERLYEHSKSHERGVGIFKDFADSLTADASSKTEEIKYVRFAIRRAHEIAEHYIKLYDSLLIKFPEEESGNKAIEWFVKHLKLIAESESYAEIREHLINANAKTKETDKKGDVAPELLLCKKELKGALSSCLSRYFKFTADEWAENIEKLSRLTRLIAAFIELFDAAFFEEKRQRAMLEYSDIERLTYKSLYSSDGTLSDFALSVRGEYSAVYIDEYQDVNSLQNKIFEAISTETNRFMVGDIKQSIYVFRSARPDIFAEMKNTFPPLEEAEGSSSASVFMSENFRCDEGIIDFVNGIFDNAFSLFGGSIGYVPEDRLKYSKLNGTAEKKLRPEIRIFTNENDNEDDDDRDPSPIWVADKISLLVSEGRLNNGDPISFGDIAILLRKDMGRCKAYADALRKLAIPVRTSADRSFFLNSEIQLTLCLLNAIDNPRRDIYLAGLMLSPLYAFTPDELYLIRKLGGSSTSLWQSLTKYSAEHQEFTKGSEFIRCLNHYRAISEGIKIDAFLLRLYHETGLLALAKRGGKDENLMLLYNYARKFEASSFEGLYNFINYINEVIDGGASFTSAETDPGDDAVTIITAHKSKGLEYPIVFIADANSALVPMQEKAVRVSYSDEYGIGMKTRTDRGYALVESPVHNVIIDSNIEKIIEEELRVYYVALTRAREQLFVTGHLKGTSREEYLDSLTAKRLKPSGQTLWELKNLLDIIMLSEPDADVVFEKNSYTSPLTLTNTPSDAPVAALNALDGAYDKLAERFSFKYPYEHMTVLPEKMSVSRLYPTVLDELDDDGRLTIDTEQKKPDGRLGILPAFISGAPEEESARRGIATHNFLQFLDISRFESCTVEEELENLVKAEFISKENAARVRLNEIDLFKRSTLCGEMRSASRLFREFRFSVMLPASLFTQDKNKKILYANSEILLQGVIDCIIEDPDGELHLIDYKTDRLTKQELADKNLAQRVLSEKHALQLSYYSLAIEKIFGKRPKTVKIYSLPLGDTVDIEPII